MSAKVSVVLSDEQLKQLKKLYENSNKEMTFEGFIDYSLENAIKNHLYVTSASENLMDLFNGKMDVNEDFGGINDFVQKMFEKATNNETDIKSDIKPKKNEEVIKDNKKKN